MPPTKRGKGKNQRKQKRVRDYKAEYARRIERGLALGLDKRVARGHPKKTDISIDKARDLVEKLQKFQHDTSRLAKNEAKEAVHKLARQKKDLGAFMKIALAAGLSRVEAYELWY